MAAKKAYIDVYTSGGNFDRNFYEGICIRSVKEPELRNQFTLGYMIAMFEEQTLLQLEDEIQAYYNDQRNNNNNNSYYNRGYNSNRSYFGGDYHSAFHQKLDELAARLNVNIQVFIGHIEICTDFLQKIENRFPVTEPTLVLLIGCLGTHYAAEANQKDAWRGQPIAVMAFDNLLHIYDNKIYGCELSHKSLPNMMCEYDGVEQDYKNLLDMYDGDGSDTLGEEEAVTASYDRENELVKCCKAKLDRFSSVFLKHLRKRNCVEFTMENLETKMRNLLNEDGTINREKLENHENYIFYLRDGVPCTEEDCDISNPFEASIKTAEEYNRRSTLLNLYETFNKFIEDKKDDDDKEEVLLKQLQALRPEEKAIVNYQQNGRTILHTLAWCGYPRCIEYLIKKFDTLPFQSLDEEPSHYFLEDLVLNFYNSEDEKLSVLLKVHEKFPEMLHSDLPNRHDILYYATNLHYVKIVTFLSENTPFVFSEKKYEFSGYYKANLLFVACNNIFLEDAESYDLVKLLLAKGVDPNEEIVINNDGDTWDILGFYFETNLLVINPKIIRALCNYGYNRVLTIDYFLKQFTNLLKGGKVLLDYKLHWGNIYGRERNNVNEPSEKDRINSKIDDLVDAVFLDFPKVLKQTIKTLEDSKKYIVKGKKTTKQLHANLTRNYKRLTNNLKKVTRKLTAPEKISSKYSEIDAYIKTVGAKFTKEEKKAFREQGIKVVQNKNTNALERLQTLENLLINIQEQAAKRGEGGRRYKITRKKYRN